MKDLEKLEKLEKLLEEFKGCLEDGGLDELAEKKKEENKNNIKNAKGKIKEYLEDETVGMIFLNDERCVTVGPKSALLSLFACLINSFEGHIDLDELVHAFIGGVALLDEGMELDKDKVKEVIKDLKKYL